MNTSASPSATPSFLPQQVFVFLRHQLTIDRPHVLRGKWGLFRSAFLPEQIVLLAYRALCSVTYNDTLTEALVSIVKKADVAHPLYDPERFKRLLRFKARDILLQAKQSYEQVLLTKDYEQLGWSVYPMNVQPCIAATYSRVNVRLA